MKFKHKLLFSLIILLISLLTLLSNDYEIKKTIVLQSSPKIVFSILENTKTWKNWMPYISNDNIEVKLSKKGVGERITIRWNGKRPGRLIIHEKSINWGIAFSQYFDDFPEKNRVKISYLEIPEGLQVTFHILGINSYPLIGKFMALLDKFKMEKEASAALIKLKSQASKASSI